MTTKKRKRFMRLELLETSAVGTPAYADAHFSLFKSLSNAYQDLKGGQEKMAEEEITENKVEEVKPVEEEVKTETETVVVEEEVKSAVVEEIKEIKSVEANVEKADKLDQLIATIKDVIAKMPVERALVETKSSVDKVKSASAGELFLAMLK